MDQVMQYVWMLRWQFDQIRAKPPISWSRRMKHTLCTGRSFHRLSPHMLMVLHSHYLKFSHPHQFTSRTISIIYAPHNPHSPLTVPSHPPHTLTNTDVISLHALELFKVLLTHSNRHCTPCYTLL